jgi:hypothetical protein
MAMKEPSFEDDVTRKPATRQQETGQGRNQPRWGMPPQVKKPFLLRPAKTAGEKTAVRFRKLGIVASPRGEDGFCREEARFDRRQNSFATLGIRQSSRIPDQQKAVAGNIPLAISI